MDSEYSTATMCSSKFQAIFMFILAIVFVTLWYNMIKASYADDGHECKSKLWARYTGFWLLFVASVSLISSAYFIYAVLRKC